MSIQKIVKSIAIITLAIFLAVCTLGCGEVQTTEQDSAETAEPEKATVVYEAVFLDEQQIADIFDEIRGQAPYSNVTQDFHVTTAFLPETDARFLYGQEVEVHIVGYKAGAVTDDDGNETHNEGLKVELSSQDEDMAVYLTEHPANYHVTGSYETAPKYTGYLDFTDMQTVEYTVTGRFGAYLNGGAITFDAGEVEN